MKKNLFLTTITAIAVTVAFVSCQQDEHEPNSNSRMEARFSTNIVKETPLATRAAGDKWHENDSIGIFMFEEQYTNVVEGMGNVKYTTEDGGKTGEFTATDKIIYFPDNGAKVRFMSYYPYTENIENNIYKVDVSDQTNQPAIDLLYSFNDAAKYDKTSPDKKVSLVFDHMLTKININIKAGDGLEDSDLDNIEVYFEGFNTEVNFNLISGSLSEPSDISNIIPAKITKKEEYYVSYEAIIIPTEDPRSAKIVFDLQNGNEGEPSKSDVFTWKFNNVNLIKGTEYTYNVTISRSGIVVEAIINDWAPGGENNITAE